MAGIKEEFEFNEEFESEKKLCFLKPETFIVLMGISIRKSL